MCKQDKLRLDVPIGKLIYEMAVQFGTIKIKHDNEEIMIQCDTKGENLEHWVYRDLRINKDDFDMLKSAYRGRYNLNTINKVWKKLTQKFLWLEE